MELTVYADVLFLTNFWVDSLLLCITLRILRLPLRLWRIAVAAAMLGIYGVLMFRPEIGFLYGFLGKSAVSVLAAILVTERRSFRTCAKVWIVFWLTSLVAGGVVWAFAMGGFLGFLRPVAVGNVLYMDLPFPLLLLGIVGTYLLLWRASRLAVRTYGQDAQILPLTVTMQGESVTLQTLSDTGCSLCTPVTDDGVILMPRSMLPKAWEVQMFFLTMHTASGSQSIPAFYPESVTCDEAYEIIGNPAVGIVEELFSEQYDAVCNPNIIRKINGGEAHEAVFSANIAAKISAKDKTFRRIGSILHRKRNYTSGAADRGRGSDGAAATGNPRNPSGGTANPDRAKSAAGGLHRTEV